MRTIAIPDFRATPKCTRKTRDLAQIYQFFTSRSGQAVRSLGASTQTLRTLAGRLFDVTPLLLVACIEIFLSSCLFADTRDLLPTTKIYGPQGDFDPFLGLPGIRGVFGTRLAAGDLNGDNIDDLAIAEKDSIRIIFGQTSPSLVDVTINLKTPPSSPIYKTATITISGFVSDVAIGDVIGDSANELVCGSGAGISVIPGKNITVGSSGSPSSFVGSTGTSFGSGASSRSLCLLDWDSNGRLDVAVGSASGASVYGISGTEASGYSVSVLQSFATGEVEDIACGDVDGNGYPDLVIGCPKNLNSSDYMPDYGQVFVKLNRRISDSITIRGIGSFRSCGQRVACGDANGDGRCEVLVGSPGGAGRVGFLYGGSSIATSQTMGTLTELLSGSTVGEAVQIVDVNADGYGDMIFGQPENNSSFMGAVYINYGGPGGGARTVQSLTAFDRYGLGDIAAGNFYGGEFLAMVVGAYDSFATNNSQGAAYVTALPADSISGSALYYSWTKAGDGPLGEIVPPTLFAKGCTAEIDFPDSDTANGGSAGIPSYESVTVYRNVSGVTPPRGDSSQLIERYWKITSSRVGYGSARITLHYPTLTGATPDQLRRLLRVYRSDSSTGPWIPLIAQSVDTNSQTISGTTFELGYFALSVAPDVLSYEFYEDFQGVTAGASLSSIGFARSNGGSTSGSTHPYWDFVTDASVRVWAGPLGSRWGAQLSSFTSGLGNSSSNVYPSVFWDPVANQSDYLLTRTFALKASSPYQLIFNIATPSANVPSSSGSDFSVYLITRSGSTFSVISQLYGVSNLKASGLLTIDFSVTNDASNYAILFADTSNPANSSFFTAIDNIIVRKTAFPTSVAPGVTVLPIGIVIRAGETLLGVPVVRITDSDDDLSRVTVSAGGLPFGTGIQLQASSGGTMLVNLIAPTTIQDGFYAMIVTVWDAYGATTVVSVPVLVTHDDYLRWASDQFGFAEATSVTPTLSLRMANPDHDSATNYVEYLFGTSPLTSTPAPDIQIDTIIINGEARRRLRWRERRPALSQLHYNIQTSTELMTWEILLPTWGTSTRTDAGADYDSVSLIESSLSGEPRRFFRISAN